MNALVLGLIAAMCWGFHDICVRFLSQKTPLTSCIFIVLVTGLVFHLGLMGFTQEVHALTPRSFWSSIAAGFCFVIATFGLYFAFERGPVRLVAPLIASYPILSVLLATLQGSTATALQWVAVLAIVVGVGLVAALSEDNPDEVPAYGPTVLFSLISACGFAGTFALGQMAADLSGELSTTLVTRIMAVALVIAILLLFKKPFWPGKSALPWLIAMGIADGVALYVVMSAGALPSPEIAAVTSSMFGLVTIVLAWILLKERMTVPQWAGCVVAFVGVGVLAL
ncbi:DMT family transporter [Octadecabacter ascidiaceicola]|uniref:EamA-like transporter family protein n=1 Tax=Octadecabacter ascidiaceicola TaxID=1655543 RepID=A0A238KIK1_9RHOB|nr:DMT family transporter [Octadecabacter ascidiaceicola]SMX42498.1 EamA-like transporter family protein [Octadecabacter ascidiaceicola]